MAIDLDAYIAAIKPATQIVFLTNPHSPSGTWLEEADVRRVVEAAPNALVVLDEAYVHYSETPGYLHLAREYENLIVLRTFSKAFGLAGLRIGFGVAPVPVIRALLAVKPTWNMGQLQIAGGVAALDDDAHVDRTVQAIVAGRAYAAIASRRSIGSVWSPTAARTSSWSGSWTPIDSTSVFEGLLERGVIVKDGCRSAGSTTGSCGPT